MKILAFSNCPLDPVLGSGRTRLAWSAGLRELGHEVQIVDTTALLADVPEDAAGRRLRMGWNGWRWLRKHGFEDVDLIEFYGAEFWPATWRLAAREGRRRPFLAAHTDGLELLAVDRLAAAGAEEQPPYWRAAAAGLLRRGETLAFSRCDGFVTGCQLDRRYLVDHGIGNPARMEVVSLGLEPPFLDRPLDGMRGQRVAFLGSWIARKGTAHLVATMTPLLKKRPGLHLDLFGLGTAAGEVSAAFPPAVLSQITIHGRLSLAELIAGISQARVFFSPSEYEGFGLALAEAMACGCALVTTPTGFGAELVADEEALVCNFGDVPAMGQSIERLLDDDALCARIVRTGWQRVQALRWATSVRQLEQTYLRWIAERN